MTGPELQRYARHLSLAEFGIEGQERLHAASVLCIGAGGLGSPALLYLAAAGLGKIGIVDPDIVSLSNLQRQIIHGQSTIGHLKTDSARSRLAEVNPHVQVETFPFRLTGGNSQEIATAYDIILDGSDNFATRYLTSDAGVWLRKPVIYGAVQSFEGQVAVFAPHLGGPCYRCMFPQPPPPGAVPSCEENGVLGVLPGIVGLLQATEAIKLLTGIGTPLIGKMLHFDALTMTFREFRLRRDPQCAVCGEAPTIDSPVDYDAFSPPPSCAMKNSPNSHEISVTELAEILKSPLPNFVLLDVREPVEREICTIPGAISIPLGELPSRIAELNPEDRIAIHCKSGGRSAKAVAHCRAQGFPHVANVAGGILAWAELVDKSTPVY